MEPLLIQKLRTERIQFVNAGAPVQPLWKAGPRGSRIHLISASQDDTGTPLMSFFRGRVLTDNAMPSPGFTLGRTTGALPPVLTATKTTNDHLDRTNGSFVQDGWVAGNLLAIINSIDNPQNQVVAHVTTVAATTLTYTGTPLNATAAAMAIFTQLVLANLMWAKTLTASAGSSNSAAAVSMMDPSLFPAFLAAPGTFISLEPGELLLVKCGTLPAANSAVMVTADGGDY